MRNKRKAKAWYTEIPVEPKVLLKFFQNENRDEHFQFEVSVSEKLIFVPLMVNNPAIKPFLETR